MPFAWPTSLGFHRQLTKVLYPPLPPSSSGPKRVILKNPIVHGKGTSIDDAYEVSLVQTGSSEQRATSRKVIN